MIFGSARRADIRCPECGFVQSEPARVVSTFCRSCGAHIDAGCRPGRPLPPAPAVRALAVRDVLCQSCGTVHSVSAAALATSCPACACAISLKDIEVGEPRGVAVNTRGRLHVLPGGALSASRIYCGGARIEGPVTGRLSSCGTVRLALSGSHACHVQAPCVVVERGSRLRLTQPLETQRLIVAGWLTATVWCRGVVEVRRGGGLEAEVFAQAVRVEKGGALLGTCHVQAVTVDSLSGVAGGKSLPERDTLTAPAAVCVG